MICFLYDGQHYFLNAISPWQTNWYVTFVWTCCDGVCIGVAFSVGLHRACILHLLLKTLATKVPTSGAKVQQPTMPRATYRKSVNLKTTTGYLVALSLQVRYMRNLDSSSLCHTKQGTNVNHQPTKCALVFSATRSILKGPLMAAILEIKHTLIILGPQWIKPFWTRSNTLLQLYCEPVAYVRCMFVCTTYYVDTFIVYCNYMWRFIMIRFNKFTAEKSVHLSSESH